MVLQVVTFIVININEGNTTDDTVGDEIIFPLSSEFLAETLVIKNR